MTDVEVMQMPLRRFWLMQGNISRITAAGDMRDLSKIRASAGAKEDVEEYTGNLLLEIGTVSKSEEKLDRAGLQRLATLA